MKNRTKKLLSIMLMTAMVFTMNSFTLASPGEYAVVMENKRAEFKPGEAAEFNGWTISENKTCTKVLSLSENEKTGKVCCADMYVSGEGEDGIDLTVYGSTDLDQMSLRFFIDGGNENPDTYWLSESHSDHITIDIKQGETGNSFDGRTCVSVSIDQIKGLRDFLYDRIQIDNDKQSIEYINGCDHAALATALKEVFLKNLITVRDNDTICWDYDFRITQNGYEDALVFVFYEETYGKKEVSYRGWTVKDTSAMYDKASDRSLRIGRANRKDGDFYYAAIISPYEIESKNNPVETTVTGSTGLKQLSLNYYDGSKIYDDEKDYEYNTPRRLSTLSNDKITLNISRSASFKEGDKTEVLIDFRYFDEEKCDDPAFRDGIITVPENPGVTVNKEKSDKTCWKYTFTAISNTEKAEEAKEDLISKAMENNEPCNPAAADLEGGYKVSYNSYIPYFGKSLNKDKFKELGIKVTVNGTELTATKGKIVRKKGAAETVSNASSVITTLEGSEMEK